MAVKDALLALLAAGPRHGYQLKSEFDAATGMSWPLNVGQVYTTLQRLERDGLIVADGAPDTEGRHRYRLTAEGDRQLRRWFDQPAKQALASRDELPLKVMLAVATDVTPALALVNGERSAAMTTLQDLTTMKTERDATLAARLQVDRMVLRVEAEIRWLDMVEERLLEAGDTHERRRVDARRDDSPQEETMAKETIAEETT